MKDVISQVTVASDTRKVLGFICDFQALAAWHDSERKRRGLL